MRGRRRLWNVNLIGQRRQALGWRWLTPLALGLKGLLKGFCDLNETIRFLLAAFQLGALLGDDFVQEIEIGGGGGIY